MVVVAVAMEWATSVCIVAVEYVVVVVVVPIFFYVLVDAAATVQVLSFAVFAIV